MSRLEGVADADADVVAGNPPPSARVPLDRERIVAAAIAYIDDQGLSGLTMRRLGTALGVEAMSLYRYVPGKEDLLDAVVDSLVDGMSRDDDVLQAPRDGWQDYLQRLAHGVRRVALDHPKAFPLVASRPPEAPWLRPPLRNLAWVEAFLAGLLTEGFSDSGAVASYRAYSSFLLGHLLLEVSQKGVQINAEDAPEGVPDTGTDLSQYPLVVELEELLSRDETAAEFEEALENLLGRLETLRREGRVPGDPETAS